MNTSGQSDEFLFRHTDEIGDVDAEFDPFLEDCFVDTGDYSNLKDLKHNKIIILGRTGQGKSALLVRLESEMPDRVIRIEPSSLALSYITNSQILNYLSELGVDFEPFFKMLWRHVISVEILSAYFNA